MEQLSRLREWHAEEHERPFVTVISGPAGVGKTALALRWLHDVRPRFPDGQLYVNLGGFAEANPVAPEEVLEWFLLALGLPAERIPPGLAPREALYRSLTADRVIATLLDNAFSVAQVRPLLPASPLATVVVTSRSRLTGLRLAGARFLEVDPMDVQDSVHLLDLVVGDDRTHRERTETEELARLCGGLPIALSVIGARLLAHPRRPISREVGDLRGRNRLAVLAVGDERPVQAVFDLSYRALPEREARVYRRSALHPGDTFGAEVIAEATELAAGDTEDALDTLVERSLLTEIADRRFRYHDLLLVHARQRATEEDDPAVRDGALRAMIEWYLDVAVVADLVLRPSRRRVGPRFGADGRRPMVFSSHDAALRWLDLERGNLLRAAQAADDHEWPNLVWELCESLWGFFLHTRHYDDWLALHEIGIPAARACDKPVAEARLRAQLATALRNLRRYDEARRENQLTLELAERTGDRFTEATALAELADLAQSTGDLAGALANLGRALAIRAEIGTPRAEALCRRRTGEVLAEMDRFDEAIPALSAAATAMRELGDEAQEARALASLASTYARSGRPADAVAPLTTALALAERLGSPHYRAEVHAAWGDVEACQGNRDAARSHYAIAYDIYTSSGDPKADDLAARLAATNP